METMTVLRILFTALLCVPVLGFSIFLIGKLMDEGFKKTRRQR